MAKRHAPKRDCGPTTDGDTDTIDGKLSLKLIQTPHMGGHPR